MTEKVTNKVKKINKNIPKYKQKIVVNFLARVLSIFKNINNITKNKW